MLTFLYRSHFLHKEAAWNNLLLSLRKQQYQEMPFTNQSASEWCQYNAQWIIKITTTFPSRSGMLTDGKKMLRKGSLTTVNASLAFLLLNSVIPGTLPWKRGLRPVLSILRTNAQTVIQVSTKSTEGIRKRKDEVKLLFLGGMADTEAHYIQFSPC